MTSPLHQYYIGNGKSHSIFQRNVVSFVPRRPCVAGLCMYLPAYPNCTPAIHCASRSHASPPTHQSSPRTARRASDSKPRHRARRMRRRTTLAAAAAPSSSRRLPLPHLLLLVLATLALAPCIMAGDAAAPAGIIRLPSLPPSLPPSASHSMPSFPNRLPSHRRTNGGRARSPSLLPTPSLGPSL